MGRVGERGLGLTKPPVVTVPPDARDFDRAARSAPAVAGVSFTIGALDGGFDGVAFSLAVGAVANA
jgi:hypothetical protein